jgi:hypothetical protein
MGNRHLRALTRRRLARQQAAPRRALNLNASQQAAVIEALREEFDLLNRGEPDGRAVECALRIAEGAR